MSISLQDVQHIAILAKLELNADELIMYANQLNDILKYMEQLSELNTDEIPPTSHVIDIINRLREDVPLPSLPLEEVMTMAPAKIDNQFLVPQVMEEDV